MRTVLPISVSAIVILANSTMTATSQSHSTDERAIKEGVLRFASVWNEHDMRAFSQLCTKDADFVAAFATIVTMKEDNKWLIAAFHNTLLSGPPGGVLPSDRETQ